MVTHITINTISKKEARKVGSGSNSTALYKIMVSSAIKILDIGPASAVSAMPARRSTLVK